VQLVWCLLNNVTGFPAEFMQAWNENPKPFIWTATVGQIIEKIDRARAKVEQIKPGSTLPRRKKKRG
jgi:hypothetical protein